MKTYSTVLEPAESARVREFLKTNKIQYEPSDFGSLENGTPLTYYTITTTEENAAKIDAIIDNI